MATDGWLPTWSRWFGLDTMRELAPDERLRADLEAEMPRLPLSYSPRSSRSSVTSTMSRWIKALGFVNCAEGFNVTPAAINGFSDLILSLWGDAGRHARSAIGSGELPFGMPVEVEAVVALA